MEEIKEEHITISKGNIKMGLIPSVSFPPLVTCSPDACKTCGKQHCYAVKIYNLRKTVKHSYDKNLRIYKEEPEKFWRETEAAIMTSHAFRFCVSGDIPDEEFFNKLIEVVDRNKHCEVLMFTKKFDIVNIYMATHGFVLPRNLHIIFSAWRGLEMSNPYLIPECHIIYKNGECTAEEGKNYIMCSGNCTECLCSTKGCWTLKRGEGVLIKEH